MAALIGDAWHASRAGAENPGDLRRWTASVLRHADFGTKASRRLESHEFSLNRLRAQLPAGMLTPESGRAWGGGDGQEWHQNWDQKMQFPQVPPASSNDGVKI